MSPIAPRPYSAEDLPRLTAFVGRCNAADDLLTPLHPGDLVHHLTNGVRGADPAPFTHVAENADGEPLAVVTLSKYGSFEVVVAPGRRGGDVERELLRWSADAQAALLARLNSEQQEISTAPMDTDPARAALLRELGFTAGAEPDMALTVRDLSVPWNAPVLPDGFTIRPASGLDEADAIGVLHSNAFKSNWTPGMYRKVMEAPGFDIDREMLVVAPGGDLAAFLVYWLDPISRSGLFEPVGTDASYQRRGLSRALMTHTLGLMRDAGMTRAVVLHELDNPASSAAYAALGFARKATHTTYTRAI